MSSHGGAVADGSPYLGSIFPVVMFQSTRPGPATHRCAVPVCLARLHELAAISAVVTRHATRTTAHGGRDRFRLPPRQRAERRLAACGRDAMRCRDGAAEARVGWG